MPPLPGFVSGSYTSRARMAAGERCINLITEDVKGSASKSARALLPVPGVTDFATLPDGPGRGLFFEDDRLFAVFGTTLFEIAEDGTPTAKGAVLIDEMPATLTTNGEIGGELLVSSGGKGYVLDLTTDAFAQPVNDVTQVGQVDAFLIGLDAVTGTLKISESGDGLTWDPSQIAQRSATTDRWRAMFIADREIYLFGSKTGEVWRDAGLSPFPFALRGDASFNVGIAALSSIAALGTTLAWLGQTDRGAVGVYWMNGYTPEKISTIAIDCEVQDYLDAGGISTAIGWSYAREGHEFYILTFPVQGRTWVFDATTTEWTERGKWSQDAGDFGAYRPQFHAEGFGKNLVCDRASNKIYAFSSTTYTDVGGTELRRVRRTPHSASEHRMNTFTYFELEADRGVGSLAGQGADPLVVLRYSDNGGNTWGAERTRSVGKRGAYDTRIRWAPCGAGRDRVWELASTDPAPSRWFDAYVGVRGGRV